MLMICVTVYGFVKNVHCFVTLWVLSSVIKSTLVISTSLISNNRLSQSVILVPVFNMEILEQVTKYCGKE